MTLLELFCDVDDFCQLFSRQVAPQDSVVMRMPPEIPI